MKVSFTPDAWDDYLYWQQYDRQTLHKINELIKEVLRTPFTGKGKPEPLRHELRGLWSRRINLEHRLIYSVVDEEIAIISIRYHYSGSKG